MNLHVTARFTLYLYSRLNLGFIVAGIIIAESLLINLLLYCDYG